MLLGGAVFERGEKLGKTREMIEIKNFSLNVSQRVRFCFIHFEEDYALFLSSQIILFEMI